MQSKDLSCHKFILTNEATLFDDVDDNLMVSVDDGGVQACFNEVPKLFDHPY